MSVVLRPEAVEDLRAAHAHYAEIDADLGHGFADEFDLVVERLEMFPFSGRQMDGTGDVRRARMRRFPYGVFYRVAADREVRVLRVLHAARDPDAGLD